MNNWTLKTVPVYKFGEILTTQASQLSTSKKVKDVCDSICKNIDSGSKGETKLNLFHVSGQTGSGRTTFCKAVVMNLIRNYSLKESEINYINIDKHDNPNCVWNYGVELARTKNLGSIAMLLASPNSTYMAKEKAMVGVFDSFKVVCFDNLSISETNQQQCTLLMSIIDKLKTNVICVSKPFSTRPPKYGTLVTIDGLDPVVIGSDLNWQKTIQYLKTKCVSVDENVCLNPAAVQLLVKASKIFCMLQYKAVPNQSPVLVVLNLIWENLQDHEKVVLLQLSELRQALPLKDGGPLSLVIQIGLVEYETPGTRGNLFGQVTLSDCVREFVLTKRDGNLAKSNFDVLQCWMALLSEELQGLIKDAKSNSWPFVPEKW